MAEWTSAMPAPSRLSQLRPVRQIFQSLLSDVEAARFMLLSHDTTRSLLDGCSFTQHVFRPSSPSALRQTAALYAKYGLRMTRLCLPMQWWLEPEDNELTAPPLLPRSLLALAMGQKQESGQPGAWIFDQLASLQSTGDMAQEERTARTSNQAEALLERVNPYSGWQIKPYTHAYGGGHNHSIRPGLLPPGLRYLQLSYHFNLPLAPLSIPASVTFLQCGHRFNHSLDGVLPVGLLTLVLGDEFDSLLPPGAPAVVSASLVLGDDFNKPLPPHTLPSTLQRLRLGGFDHPLRVGALPPQLQHLDTGLRFNQLLTPGLLPCSLTHVRFSHSFNQPLVRGSIPEGVVHLSLGMAFNHPLRPGVLPSTLRELVLGDAFAHVLQVGSLPPHLELLRLPNGYRPPLHAQLWPSSLRLLNLRGYAGGVLEVGVLPDTLQYVAADEEQDGAIPANASQWLHWDMFG